MANKGNRDSQHTVKLAALALLAVGVAALCVIALRPAPTTVALPKAATATTATTAAAPPAPAPLRLPSSARAVFFGDSWTAGYAAKPSKRGFAYLAADSLGWDADVDGVSGTGYLNPGPNGEGTFAARLAATKPDKTIDVLVLQGGINDQGRSDKGLAKAVSDTLTQARRTYPNAAIVVLGPAPSTLPVPDRLAFIDRTIAAETAKKSLHYISPLRGEWITSTNYSDVIDTTAEDHPSTDGHAYLAEKVAAAIQQL